MAHLQSIEHKCPGWPYSACGKRATVEVRGLGGSFGVFCAKCGKKRLADLVKAEQAQFAARKTDG
jgi:hypothetical protein